MMKLFRLTLTIGLLCATQALADSRTDRINRIITQLNPDVTASQTTGKRRAGRIEIIVQNPTTYYISDYQTSADFPVYFGLNSAKLTANGRSLLDVLAAAMQDDQIARYRYLIAGHTDAKGSAAYNLKLSRKRANAVKNYLVRMGGINPRRLMTIGWGEARLKNPNRPHAALNRRVEVSYITKRLSVLPSGTSITVWQGEQVLRKSQIVVDQIATLFPDLIVNVNSHGKPVTIETQGSNTVITVPPKKTESNSTDQSGVTIVVPAGETQHVTSPNDGRGLTAQEECAQRLANDPRPDSHTLDDFNSGRTPLKCEEYMDPIAPVDPKGIGSNTRIKIN